MYSEKLDQIFGEIEQERICQNEQWGGRVHDDQHITEEWMDYIDYQIDMLAGDLENRIVHRERFIKIAALAVAAIESIDRTREKS